MIRITKNVALIWNLTSDNFPISIIDEQIIMLRPWPWLTQLKKSYKSCSKFLKLLFRWFKNHVFLCFPTTVVDSFRKGRSSLKEGTANHRIFLCNTSSAITWISILRTTSQTYHIKHQKHPWTDNLIQSSTIY